MKHTLKRRHFIASTTLGGFGLLLTGHRAFSQAGATTANHRLNVAIIGVANRGGENLRGLLRENVNLAAFCDVDSNSLATAKQMLAKFRPNAPEPKTFADFREMLELKGLDAVLVSTPDHVHAVAAMGAMQKGLHVYCEKPLAHKVSEVRALTEAARRLKRVTQMGIQIHEGNNYRRVVELVKGGVIGAVREVHVWVQVVYGGKEMPKEFPPVPPNLNYDLWLGPIDGPPYSPEWVPFKWRNWWAFGGGTMTDFGCHYMDLPHWALDLTHPKSVEVVDGPPLHPHSVPHWLIVRYQHPARGAQPPVTLTWYQGKDRRPERLTDQQYQKWKSGVLFVGEKGEIISNYSYHELWPEQKFAGFQRPAPTIPNSKGHYREWIEAIQNGGQTTCHFDYSGPLSETALLGNVAFRAGKKLEWDWKTLKAANCPEADQFIQHKYRAGWRL